MKESPVSEQPKHSPFRVRFGFIVAFMVAVGIGCYVQFAPYFERSGPHPPLEVNFVKQLANSVNMYLGQSDGYLPTSRKALQDVLYPKYVDQMDYFDDMFRTSKKGDAYVFTPDAKGKPLASLEEGQPVVVQEHPLPYSSSRFRWEYMIVKRGNQVQHETHRSIEEEAAPAQPSE